MRAIFLSSVIASVTLAACSSSSSSTAASSSDSFIAQYCDIFSPCCAKAGLPSDGRSCKALFGAFSGGQGAYDAAAGNACLAELRSAAAKPDFCDGGTSRTETPSCKNSYKGGGGGTKAPGDACTSDKDCASSPEGTVSCVFGFANGGQTRTCQTQIVGKLGDTPCVATIDGGTRSSGGGTSAPPPRGFTCNRKDSLRCDSTTTKCTMIQDVGGPCTSASTFDGECVKAAYCDTTMKLCVARKPLGADCSTFSSGQCADGLYCDPTKKCATSLADGASCTQSSSCASGSCVNQMCQKKGSGDLGLAFLCGSSTK